MNLLMRNLLRKDFVRVEEEGNAKLLKFERQCLICLLMYEEYWRDAYSSKCCDQSASKYTKAKAITGTCSWIRPTKIQQTLDPRLDDQYLPL